ncbi:chemotaxis protein CheB [Actinomadura graeca]|uniref:protein-glutamate methylesterase n=1 Tax=Actinomadura graeca TaxID=2750812 RepID=A0ABX8QYJ5_9ACTN|nr:chemotaxis protein CheB [Actinomadura graeca]QXJ21848.1 chemotaxis protein CheB [Actinomadura graeca]
MDTAPGRDTVVIAASAGGIQALQTVMAGLPPKLPAAVLVVLHVPPTGGRALPGILDRAGWLPAAAAVDGEALEPGRIYVAPPDRHLLVEGDVIRLSHGPRQHGHRPAADPLFQSAASARGSRVVGVVLSGLLDDGAAGCAAVEDAGGIVAVQDPADSSYDGMPRAALAATGHAVALPAAEIGAFLAEQSRTPVVAARPRTRQVDAESFLEPEPAAADPPGSWSGMTCPECGGPLNVRSDTRPVRYACRLGHGWSAASLLGGQDEAVERALWIAALRLEERVRLTERMAAAAEERGHLRSADVFRASSRESGEALATIRSLIEELSPPVPDEVGGRGETGNGAG